MPEIGDIEDKINLGYNYYGKVIWLACLDCGKERWVNFRKEKTARYCFRCVRRLQHKVGSSNPNWKGGRIPRGDGYIDIYLSPDNPFFSMADAKGAGGYVLEHRLVMAQYLGRCLASWEEVHHGDRNRSNNVISNLKLIPSKGEHFLITKLGKRIDELQERVTLLEAENVLLKIQQEVSDEVS